MDLNFNKEGNVFVAEFEVTSDFNLHIERLNGGIIDMYQRTSSEGEYTIIDGFDTDGKAVLDIDFTALIYPKGIKIISEKEPTMAVVTFNA